MTIERKSYRFLDPALPSTSQNLRCLSARSPSSCIVDLTAPKSRDTAVDPENTTWSQGAGAVEKAMIDRSGMTHCPLALEGEPAARAAIFERATPRVSQTVFIPKSPRKRERAQQMLFVPPAISRAPSGFRSPSSSCPTSVATLSPGPEAPGIQRAELYRLTLVLSVVRRSAWKAPNHAYANQMAVKLDLIVPNNINWLAAHCKADALAGRRHQRADQF